MNYLDLLPSAKHDEVVKFLEAKQQWTGQPKKGFLRYRKPLEDVAHIRAAECDFSGDVVRIGDGGELREEDLSLVHRTLRTFMPWRKGPFSIFGIDVDAEWRSERKWNRLLPEIPSLRGKTIADIGSNNGYYMFRMAHHDPALVLGFEPYLQHHFAFHLLNGFAGCANLQTELMGVEDLPLFPGCFDVVFLLGIIYHRPSPIDTLNNVLSALKPGGTLLLESQVIPGDEPVALFPDKTYAKVPGTWFVPTGLCLQNWLERCGYRNIQLFCSHPMNSGEQRRTDWMTFESYEDFIDKKDARLTIEGYPAPWRVFFKAEKG